MLMKLLVNAFERARSKLSLARSNERISSESDVAITNFDYKQSSTVRQQPRSSLSKWLCAMPSSVDKPIPSSSRSDRVRRSSSWRSLKERGGAHSITSRTFSVDELHRNNKHGLSNGAKSHTRFDRLSSTMVHYSDPQKKSHRRAPGKGSEQQISSTLSRSSGGGDSGYSEDSFGTRSFRRPLHTSCPHCHCERRSSFSHYKKSRNHSSTESSPSDLVVVKKPSDRNQYSKDNLLSSQSYPHIKPLPKFNTNSQVKTTRTLTDKRRRNLSCDGSLWTRLPVQKPITLASSPVFSEMNHQRLQGHFTTITTPPEANSNLFGELNLAAIELDSLRASLSSSSYTSSSSSSINKQHHRRTSLVWHEYQNPSLSSTKLFAVRRGDQVRVLKRIGKTTLLVQKPDDGEIGFLPQTCLAHHQINSFLSLKGLRETVL